MKAICGFLGIIFILASCYLGGFWFGYHKSYPEDVWGFLILGQSLGLFSGGVMLLAFAKFLFGKEVKQKE